MVKRNRYGTRQTAQDNDNVEGVIMEIEVLVSTMNQKDYSLVERMRIQTGAVVVNQCQEDSVTEYYANGNRIKWINTTTKGLSVSRNICLSEASGDICLIADDDLEYVDGYADIVKAAFSRNKDASIIRFKVQGIEKSFKNYPNKGERIGYIKSLKISSVEIAFRKTSIEGNHFDELLGAGAKYYMGEENEFLTKCLKKGLKIYFYPEIISNLHIIGSSWRGVSDEQYLFGRGAAFAAMGARVSHFLILQFAIRKRNLFDKSLSVLKRIKIMESGRSDYLREKIKRGNKID